MKAVSSVVMILVLSGCATTKPLGTIPTSVEEYRLSKSELVQRYPDIQTYEKSWRGFFPNYPLETDLRQKLGEPTKKKIRWGYPLTVGGTLLLLGADPVVWGLVVAIRPDAPRYYYYDKGNYCIEALLDRTFVSLYSRYMVRWKWMTDKEKCK